MIKLKNVFSVGLKTTLMAGLICAYLSFMQGCARTVSPLTPDITISFKITFREAIDTSKYNYYLIFSTESPPFVPQQNIEEYFITPGRSFDTFNSHYRSREISYYYATYFSTWSDYILLSNQSISLYKSNSTGFSASTTLDSHAQYQASLGAAIESNQATQPKTLEYQFPLSLLSDTTLTTSEKTLYYTLVTSERNTKGTNEGTGMVIDVTTEIESSTSIMTRKGYVDLLTQDRTSDTNYGPADIVQWEIRLF